MLNFLTESSKNFEETQTIGSFGLGNSKNSFESIYEQAHDLMMSYNIDPKIDINTMIKQDAIMEQYKDALLEQLKNDAAEYDSRMDSGRYSSLYEQTSAMFDNCRADLIAESTRVGQLLPIKAVDFPVLIKQNLALASKDIIQTEVTKSPIIKKHIERRWIVDKKTGKRWEYPQCFFNNEWKEAYAAGKGTPIDKSAVTIPCFNYSIPENLCTTSEDPTREFINHNIKITKVHLKAVPASGTPGSADYVPAIEGGDVSVDMRVNLSDGTWLGGTIKDADGRVVDIITGTCDFQNSIVSLSSASGAVDKVYFDGYMSNELNERTVTYDRTREEYEWKIEDGFRADIAYSLEELEDAKALMDMDLYKLTYNDLSDTLVQMEDNQILAFLDEQYDKYRGVDLDPLGFNPFIREQVFSCDSTTQTVALQSEYIQKMLKFYVDRFVIDILDTAKMENLTFVLYGNPRYISLLDPEINWVVKSGDSVGGVKLNYSYGIMNAGGVKIQVVSTMKYNEIRKDSGRHLRFIPYPLSDDQFTFKHYKYTTHILTAQNSGYRAYDRPGGSMTYLMGTTRNTTAAIQGIQGSITLTNTPFILSPNS